MLKKIFLVTCSGILLSMILIMSPIHIKQREFQETPLHGAMSPWLTHITKNLKEKNTGIAIAIDKTGARINLTWRAYWPYTQQTLFAAIIDALEPMAEQTLMPVELTFIRTFPEHTLHNSFAYLQPLFAQGFQNVDWQKVTTLITATETARKKNDPTDPWQKHDLCIFITAHDNRSSTPIENKSAAESSPTQSSLPLGYAKFVIKADDPTGSIILDELVVTETAQRRGLAKILISCIYTIIPAIKQIALYVRPTNIQAQTAYLAYGFTQQEIEDATCSKNWCYFVYDSAAEHLLQDTAQEIEEQK